MGTLLSENYLLSNGVTSDCFKIVYSCSVQLVTLTIVLLPCGNRNESNTDRHYDTISMAWQSAESIGHKSNSCLLHSGLGKTQHHPTLNVSHNGDVRKINFDHYTYMQT